MGAQIDPALLPARERELMELCLRLSPSDLAHHRFVWDYLCAQELWLAISLVLVGAEQEVEEPDLRRVEAIVEDLSYEMWAAPGSARQWVDEQLRRSGRPGRPGRR